MEDIRKGVSDAISELEAVKNKWPRMYTQDVIDLLKRLEGRINQAIECEQEENERV